MEGAPPTSEEIHQIRTDLANKIADSGLLADVEQADLDRINSDDKYVTKFFRHVFDHPGLQTEAAVKMILSTLKWRKEMGACSLREEDFPPGMFERGALFSHNRFGQIRLRERRVSQMFSQGQGRTEAAGVLCLQTRQGH